MKDFQIFSDTACDLPQDLLDEYQIKLIPFYITFDEDRYYKERVELDIEEFYETLQNKRALSHTSLPSVQDYIQQFKPVLAAGSDIICFCISQKFSGSYQSAVNAKKILMKTYTQAKITIIDSIQATGAQGLLLLQAAKMQKAGYTYEGCIKKIEKLTSTSRIMFTLDNLEYLSSGGRLGKVAAMAGNILNLKPLIKLKCAELIPYTKVRGREKAIDKILAMVEEYFTDTREHPEDYDFCVINANTLEDAVQLKKRFEQFINRTLTLPIFQIGATIGTYSGPGAIGICFVKKYTSVV